MRVRRKTRVTHDSWGPIKAVSIFFTVLLKLKGIAIHTFKQDQLLDLIFGCIPLTLVSYQ